MHENTRRAIYRVLFVAVCLVPTLGTTTWAWIRSTGFANARRCRWWKTHLAAHLPVRATAITIDSIESPAPEQTVFRNLRLRDDLTEQAILVIPSLRVFRVRGQYQLAAAQVEAKLSDLADLGRLFDDIFLNEETRRVKWSIRRLVLHSASDVTELSAVQWTTRETGRNEAWLRFRLTSEGSFVALGVRHNEESGDVHYFLDTQGQELPCAILAPFLPGVVSLGQKATFRGQITVTRDRDDRRNLLVKGRFAAIDLSELVKRLPTGFGLSGSATFEGDLHWYDGQIVDASGRLSSSLANNRTTTPQTSPTFDSRWLGVGRQVGISVSSQQLSLSSFVLYRQLDFGFRLQNGYVTLDAPRGAMLTAIDGKTLLSIESPFRASVAQVIDAVVGESSDGLLVSPQAARLLRWFR